MDEQEKKEILSENFPSNSKITKSKSSCEKTPGIKLEKVITGDVKIQKRSFGKRVAETFLEDNTRSVTSYILYDVVIPAAKEMISEMIGGGIDMLLFGERRRSRSINNKPGTGSFTSYGSYFNKSVNRDREQPRDISRMARARHDFGEIVLSSRGEAEDVLSGLVDSLEEYKSVSVADLYDLLGIESNFTDNKYGWTDLRDASVSRVRGGYLINLPRPILID